MINASELKKGDVAKIDGAPHIVENVSVQKPSARGSSSLYKLRFRNLLTKRKVDLTFRGDDPLEEADFERRPVQYLFGDESGCTLMDLQDYTQFSLTKEDLEDEWPYITEGLEGMIALVSDGRAVGLQLPLLVAMTIVETSPAVKGGSATSRTKPATLSTGLVIQVPEYLTSGEVVRVDTRTGEYVGKA
jgi:elongation factor P